MDDENYVELFEEAHWFKTGSESIEKDIMR